jgi:tetraacyldisaccharide 4'-kinase
MTSPRASIVDPVRNTCPTGSGKWRYRFAAHIMNAPPPLLPKWCRCALKAASIPYGLIARAHAVFYQKGFFTSHPLPCKVISLGNITVGGTGKTPLTVYLARLLQQLGQRVVILSRGYQGSAQKRGGVVSDGATILMGPSFAGDEPVMMAYQLPGTPIVVGRDRLSTGTLAFRRFLPDVILLDDAYQHLQLHRDVNLILLDGKRPLGNGCLLPAGPLREPTSALARADAVVFTRCEKALTPPNQMALEPLGQRPVFKSDHQPYLAGVIRGGCTLARPNIDEKSKVLGIESLNESRIWGFAGIARNGEFLNTIQSFTRHVLGFSPFADHHPYTVEEVAQVGRDALAAGAQFILTTEKDSVRLPTHVRLPLDLVILGIKIAFKPGSEFDAYIERCVHQWASAAE